MGKVSVYKVYTVPVELFNAGFLMLRHEILLCYFGIFNDLRALYSYEIKPYPWSQIKKCELKAVDRENQ
ncbi:hypothetical protein FNH22_18935 [Fulvivirga sp. M361]|uniref:hypothetical protein n=1 Tax=Fulvivirga sp. M361 TaxID=2594266 RepID=UPI00117A7AE7|nr:hypothetical protein [Fulvivirga sp. M361]TRX54831.1 hypothetical protein FNH22_18935 [Fulvivirga sp. M361]